MSNFDREYRFAAGQAGVKKAGFEIGMTTANRPIPLHISFYINKEDSETPNIGRISLWNLNDEHLEILHSKNCVVTLRAGYGTNIPLIFVGAVTYIETALDSADRATHIEAADGRIELRDTHLSLSYSGKINARNVLDDIAKAMGVAVSYSHNAKFSDFNNGYSVIGKARSALDKACTTSGLQWSIHNGILQVKNKGDSMTREVFVLSADSGLIGIPAKMAYSASDSNYGEESGYVVEYLLNGAIGIGDFIRLESKYVKGYFRVRSVEISGDNLEGDWICTAKLVEA